MKQCRKFSRIRPLQHSSHSGLHGISSGKGHKFSMSFLHIFILQTLQHCKGLVGISPKGAINKHSSTRLRAGPGKSRPRRPAPRSGCRPVQPKSEGMVCCSHIPLQLALLTDLNVVSIIWCTPRNEENRFQGFSQLLHFVWLSDKFCFDVRQ